MRSLRGVHRAPLPQRTRRRVVEQTYARNNKRTRCARDTALPLRAYAAATFANEQRQRGFSLRDCLHHAALTYVATASRTRAQPATHRTHDIFSKASRRGISSSTLLYVDHTAMSLILLSPLVQHGHCLCRTCMPHPTPLPHPIPHTATHHLWTILCPSHASYLSAHATIMD